MSHSYLEDLLLFTAIGGNFLWMLLSRWAMSLLLVWERKLENLCAIHLMKQYSNTDEPRLFYYNRNIEVDFYVPDVGLAVQVSFDMNDTEKRNREISALVSLNKVFPLQRAVIVTRDHEEKITTNELIV